MAASREDIERWLAQGKREHATHVIVVCDTFDWDDYPVYVKPGEDVRKRAAEYGKPDATGLPTLPNDNMQKVMEVYALHLPLEPQMNERRAFHLESAHRQSRGFTLIELLIVVAIIGIIALIAIPMLITAKTPEEAYAKCAPQPRGGGVWYFTCNAENFSMALGRFRDTHPDLRVVSVAPASGETGQYGATVVTEPAPRLPAEAQ